VAASAISLWQRAVAAAINLRLFFEVTDYQRGPSVPVSEIGNGKHHDR
jgi:hypothetical protein